MLYSMSMEVPLKIEKLVKRYGDLVAADEISFKLEEGEIFGLLGPNGAGKTTTISCVTTLENPTSGMIEVFGMAPKEAKRLVGYVPQELISHGYFTVKEILQIHSSYYGLPKNKKRIQYLLEKLELTEHQNKHVKQLSGGMKRRLLIAKALVHSPKLLLLDEPTAGVDIELRSQLWQFVKEMKSEGITILLTTHYLEEAERLCDRVGILNHGRLQTVGHTSGLIKDLTQREIILTLSEPHPNIDHPLLKVQEDHTLIFLIPQDYAIKRLFAEIHFALDNIIDIHIREGNLSDAFQRVLEKHYDA